MLGYSFPSPGNVVGGVQTNLSRIPPEPHADFPWMFCEKADFIEGIGVQPGTLSPGDQPAVYGDLAKALTTSIDYTTANGADPVTLGPAFNLAKYKLTYRSPNWTVLGDMDVPVPSEGQNKGRKQGELGRFVERKFKLSARSFNYPPGTFKYVDADPTKRTGLNENPALIVPGIELHYIWKDVPGTNPPVYQAAIGTVNSQDFDNGFWPAGTLLCMPPDIQFKPQASGFAAYEIDFVFNYNPVGTAPNLGWNNVFRRSTLTFSPVTTTGVAGDQPPYSTSSFGDLFTLPAI
jgi:hypothetical protein